MTVQIPQINMCTSSMLYWNCNIDLLCRLNYLSLRTLLKRKTKIGEGQPSVEDFYLLGQLWRNPLETEINPSYNFFFNPAMIDFLSLALCVCVCARVTCQIWRGHKTCSCLPQRFSSVLFSENQSWQKIRDLAQLNQSQLRVVWQWMLVG